ncbi:MAG: hypothetical protein K1X28_00645 [Parachlamydiales bacterium]|nr:hypothetical protein [Parachlamydiales bacterium]
MNSANLNLGYYGVFAEEHWKRKQFHDDLVFIPNAREAASLTIDANSMVRNSVAAAQSSNVIPVATGSAFIAGSSVVGGVLGLPVGFSIMRDTAIRSKAAYDCGDTAGAVHQTVWGLGGAGYTGLSGLLAADGIASLQGAAISSSLIPGIATSGFLMAAGILGYSGYGLKETFQFKNGLKDAQDKGGERAAVDFLNRQISLTYGEIAGKDDDELAKALQKKWNALERRVGADCACKIREELPGLLREFDPEKAKGLILEVEKSNFKQRVKHITLFVIGLITIAAFLGILLTAGPLSPLLFAIGAVLWLAVDSSSLHNYIGEKCWAWHSKDQEEVPCQTIAQAS